MSWWSSSKSDTNTTSSTSSSSSFDDSSFASDPNAFGNSSSFSGGASNNFNSLGPNSMSSDPQAALRAALEQEQQKAVVQAAIAKLTELCWDTCMGRPDAKLSSSEQACISNCADRYLDTSMFIMGRMQKQSQPRS